MSKEGEFPLLPRAGPQGHLVADAPVWIRLTAPALVTLACGAILASLWKVSVFAQVSTIVELREERGSI